MSDVLGPEAFSAQDSDSQRNDDEAQKEGKKKIGRTMECWTERGGRKTRESVASENKDNLLYLINFSKAEQESMLSNDPTCCRPMCNPARKTLSVHLL